MRPTLVSEVLIWQLLIAQAETVRALKDVIDEANVDITLANFKFFDLREVVL